MCLCMLLTDGLWWSGAADHLVFVFDCVHIYICALMLCGMLMTVGIWELSVDR